MDIYAEISLIRYRIHSFYIHIVAVFRERSKSESVAGIEADVSGYVELVVG